MITFNNNLLCVLDLETTGLVCGYHEIVQVAILPLDSDLKPHASLPAFYREMKPKHPERASKKAMRVNGLSLEKLSFAPSQEEVADDFHDWWAALKLPVGKKIIPLTQNGPFDIPRSKLWLGEALYDTSFTRRGRDTMFSALLINDRAAWRGQSIPFPSVGLKALCKYFGIDIEGHHDALADCIATAKVYKELLKMELL